MRHHLEHRHILNQDGISSCIGQISKQLTGGLQLIIVDNGIDGDIDLRTEKMGVIAEFANVVDTIAYRCPGTEARCADIDGICSMIDGSDAIFQILGGGK